MTSLICAAVLVGLLIITQEKRIKTHAGMWYAGALAISAGALAFLIGKNTETFGYGVVLDLFGRGELATILFLYVMLAPVLPSKKRLTKAVYRIRGELAILGAFLIWPHNLYFGRKYFVQLVEDPGRFDSDVFSVCAKKNERKDMETDSAPFLYLLCIDLRACSSDSHTKPSLSHSFSCKNNNIHADFRMLSGIAGAEIFQQKEKNHKNTGKVLENVWNCAGAVSWRRNRGFWTLDKRNNRKSNRRNDRRNRDEFCENR